MIHRFWSGPLPAHHQWVKTMIQTHMPYEELKDWTLDTLPSEIDLSSVDRVREEDVPRHLANLVKWWALAEYGGMWLDHDVVPLENLRSPNPYTAALPGPQRIGCVVNLPNPGSNMATSRLRDMETRTHPNRRTPWVSGDHALDLEEYPEVGYRFLPYDALGQRMPNTDLWVIHLWETSSRRSVERLSNG